MTKKVNYEELDPGIRRTVKLLNDHGFETTDSGDGKTKVGVMECALDFPHVVLVSRRTDRWSSDTMPCVIAEEAVELLEEVSGTVASQSGDGKGWWVEVSTVFTHDANSSAIVVVGFHDGLLKEASDDQENHQKDYQESRP